MTERYRLALIAHHVRKLVELIPLGDTTLPAWAMAFRRDAALLADIIETNYLNLTKEEAK